MSAAAVNNFGLAVGSLANGRTLSHSAFLWSMEEGTQELSSLFDPSQTSWTLCVSTGINDAGQISRVGFHNGNPVTFIATPVVPEPCTLVVGASCLVALLKRRRDGLS